MNVSNNDNQLSTIKTLAKGQVETKENFPILAGPVQRVCWGGGGAVFFSRPFARLATKTQPVHKGWIRPGETRVRCLGFRA